MRRRFETETCVGIADCGLCFRPRDCEKRARRFPEQFVAGPQFETILLRSGDACLPVSPLLRPDWSVSGVLLFGVRSCGNRKTEWCVEHHSSTKVLVGDVTQMC